MAAQSEITFLSLASVASIVGCNLNETKRKTSGLRCVDEKIDGWQEDRNKTRRGV